MKGFICDIAIGVINRTLLTIALGLGCVALLINLTKEVF